MKKLIFIIVFLSCTTNQANIENIGTVSTTTKKIVVHGKTTWYSISETHLIF